jgi:hypothetical protein
MKATLASNDRGKKKQEFECSMGEELLIEKAI